MRTIADIRHDRLLELIGEAGGVQQLADKLGKPYSQISQVKNRAVYNQQGARRAVGTKLAREMERAMDKPEGWMDTDSKACCTGTPAEYREQAEQEARVMSSEGRMRAWRAAANHFAELAAESGFAVEPFAFLTFVDAAIDLMDQDTSKAVTDQLFKRLLPSVGSPRGMGSAAA